MSAARINMAVTAIFVCSLFVMLLDRWLVPRGGIEPPLILQVPTFIVSFRLALVPDFRGIHLPVLPKGQGRCEKII